MALNNQQHPLTLDTLANALTELQGQLANAHAQIAAQQNNLNETQQKLTLATQQLAHQDKTSNPLIVPKVNPPQTFKGKGSITSWVTHMSNYLQNTEDHQALTIAISYLADGAHEWWIVFKETELGRSIKTWPDLKAALVSRFDILNKEKIARDKLAKWKQLRDVTSFNEDFQKILLDIPNISIDEQLDRYLRGLKSYIYRDLCTREYTRLADVMRDAERIESAYKRVVNPGRASKDIKKADQNKPQPVPMDIGNIEIEKPQKLTPEEHECCMKEGLCLRCRKPGHIAKNCPKGHRN